MEYQSQDDGTAPSPAPEDDSTLCSTVDITKRAAEMFELKERIHDKAINNIHKAQETYKIYYDKKHSDPKVLFTNSA